MVPGVGIEPTRCQATRDFKSLASTSSATQAQFDNADVTSRLILFLVGRVKDLMRNLLLIFRTVLFLVTHPRFMVNILTTQKGQTHARYRSHHFRRQNSFNG